MKTISVLNETCLCWMRIKASKNNMVFHSVICPEGYGRLIEIQKAHNQGKQVNKTSQSKCITFVDQVYKKVSSGD